ncbi:tandem-95 repeat protein [Massilia brevitalea]|uniref:tandem-95 repeat protein n=1 Tax=Massilia brevitalea TaxID=442526 RepID=UPI00273940C1|nr:Ig-like domain-containing protein [Massilia brevitalea]
MNNLRPLPFALDPNPQETARPARRPLQRRAPAPLALEQRVMFDGAAVDAVVRAAADAAPAAADAARDHASEGERTLAPAALAAPSARSVQAEAKREVVFIEDNLPDYLKLAESARQGAEVVVLDHTQDGLQQMIAALQGRQVDAIHLVTHGANGQVDLGSTRLSADNVDARAAQLGQSLSADGDLLLYGCNVADGGSGFLDSLARHMGADVAASLDTTGSAGFGNWTLEAHSGSIETAERAFDSAGWQGELQTTVFDAERRGLNFSGAVKEDPLSSATGRNNGDVMRFSNVISFNNGAVVIDAIVTTTLNSNDITVSTYDSQGTPVPDADGYFQPLTSVKTAGGSVSFKFDFVLHGTTTAVTLQNFVVNSYDIDSSGDNKVDRQFQEFKGFSRYELAKSTQLRAVPQADGSVRFEYNAATSHNNETDFYAGAYRVQVYYDSASSMTIRSGATGYQGASFSSAATAYFSLEFKIRSWGADQTDIVGTPAANLVYSNTTFTESADDDGSITSTALITLNHGTFAGTDGQTLLGVDYANLPAGLSASVVRQSDNTALLSFTGSAAAHANANDVNNFGVIFGNAAFASGNAGAVTGATRNDLVINFEDDTIVPVMIKGQSFDYAENRSTNAIIGKVVATDNVGVTGFRFANSGNSPDLSADNRFRIEADGTIRMTAIGAASASNDFEAAPDGTYSIQARDRAGNWSIARDVVLNITNLDDGTPLFSSGAVASAPENQNLLYTVQARDSIEATNGVVTYALAGGPDASLLRIDSSTGAVTLISGNLDYETKSSYSFQVQASDESNNTSSRAVLVNVSNVDEVGPAFTSPASVGANENQNLLYTAQATDSVDYTNGVVSYTLDAGGDAALLQIDSASGAVTLKGGNLDFGGKTGYSFTVRAVDASGNATLQAVTVNVTDLDDVAPVFASATNVTAIENQNLLYTAQALDSIESTDGVVRYALRPGLDAGLLDIDSASGAVTLKDGNLDYEGQREYRFTVVALDASGNAREQQVTVAVANVDEVAPAFLDTRTSADENQNLLYTAQATDDVDYTNRVVSYALQESGDAALLRIDSASGAVTLAEGNLDFESKPEYTFTVVARDETGNASTRTVTVLVADLNESPVAANASATTAEDTVLRGQLPGYTDPEGDRAEYFHVAPPQHGSVEIAANGSYVYTPARDYFGADSFAYKIDDGRGGSNTYRVDITVTPVNDAPVAGPATIRTPEDTPASGNLPRAVDAENDPVSYSVATGPAKGELVLGSDGSYTYTPHANANGSDSFVYRVSDGADSTLHTVTIVIDPVNDAPVARDTAVTTQEDTPYRGQLPAATDADNDPVSYALARGPAHGQVTVERDGRYVYTPALDFNGSDSFTYRVSDGQGGNNVYTVAITVNPVNDAPLAANDAFVTAEDQAHSGNLPVATDFDRDPVGYAVAQGPQHGSVSIAPDGRYTYTPAANYNGADRFTYTVSDGQGGSNTYAVEITVTPVNDAPVAGPDVRGNATVGLPMAPVLVAPFTDVDSTGIRYDASLPGGAALPSWLSFDPATLTFSGTPPAGALGTVEVLVRGSDGALDATTKVTITVGNPAAPGQHASIDLMTRDTGSSPNDFITADGGAGRTVTGRIDAPLGSNEVLQVSFDNGASWTSATVRGGNWTAQDNGAHNADWTIVTRVTNTAAGLSGPETTRNVTLDREAPSAPTVDSISTSSTTPTLTGQAAVRPGETLNVNVNGQDYTVPVQDGRWSLDLSTAQPSAPLLEGRSYDVVATVTDAAGNSRSGDTAGVVSVSAPVVPQLPPPQVVVAPVFTPAVPALSPVSEPAPQMLVREAVAPGSVVGGDSLLLGGGFGVRAAAPDFVDALRGAAELSDVYTRSEGFRTVVAKAEEPALVLFQGVPDQFVDAGTKLSMSVPADAFAHTQPKAIVRLAAVLQDGRPLPTWVQFNGQTGQFTGEVPKGLNGELKIKLIARDLNGREAIALFRINVGEVRANGDAAASGKAGLTERLNKAGQGKAATLRGRP